MKKKCGTEYVEEVYSVSRPWPILWHCSAL